MALPRQSGLRNMRERIRTLISNAPTLMMMLDHAAWALDAIDSLPPIPPMAAMQNLYPTGSPNHPVSSASPRRGSRSRSSSSSNSSSSSSSSNSSSSVKSKKRGSSSTFWPEKSLVRASLPKLEQMSIGKSKSNSNSNSNDSGRKRKAEDKAEGQIKKPCDEMKKSEKPSTHSNTEVKKDVRVPLSVSSLFNADVKAPLHDNKDQAHSSKRGLLRLDRSKGKENAPAPPKAAVTASRGKVAPSSLHKTEAGPSQPKIPPRIIEDITFLD